MKKEKKFKNVSRNISVMLKKDTFDKIEILAKSEERTISQMVRKLVKLALNENK